jgi:hypothetical protein
MTQAYCPVCGEPGLFDLPGRPAAICGQCHRTPIIGAELLNVLEGSVEYDFSDALPEVRAQTAELLVTAGVPFRWDDHYTLLVAPDREADVDRLLDEPAAADGINEAWPDDDADFDPEAEAADEEAMAALQLLFDAADRLTHRPADPDVIEEFRQAWAGVAGADLPYGINRVQWEIVEDIAAKLATCLEAEDTDVIGAATALRAVTRDLI